MTKCEKIRESMAYGMMASELTEAASSLANCLVLVDAYDRMGEMSFAASPELMLDVSDLGTIVSYIAKKAFAIASRGRIDAAGMSENAEYEPDTIPMPSGIDKPA